MTENLSPHLRGVLIVLSGVIVLSFDALLIRMADTSGWNVIFWRSGFIALSLLGLLVIREGSRSWQKIKACLTGIALFCTLTFGINIVLFVQSISLTSVSNTLVILAAGPMFAAIFSSLFLKEHIEGRTWISILFCTAGVLVVFSGSIHSINFQGDLLALILALIQGINFTLLRKLHDVSRIAMIGLSGLVSLPFALPSATPFALPGESYLVLAIMGIVQMPLALVLISMGTRYLKAPEVVLFMLIETFLGSLLVWFFLGESVPPATFLGGAIIIATLVWHTYLSMRKQTAQ